MSALKLSLLASRRRWPLYRANQAATINQCIRSAIYPIIIVAIPIIVIIICEDFICDVKKKIAILPGNQSISHSQSVNRICYSRTIMVWRRYLSINQSVSTNQSINQSINQIYQSGLSPRSASDSSHCDCVQKEMTLRSQSLSHSQVVNQIYHPTIIVSIL